LVVLLTGLSVAGEPPRLIGEWTVVGVERRGKAVNEVSWAGMRWTFANDTFETQPGGSTPAGIARKQPLKSSYALDDTKAPCHFNWTVGTGDKAKEIKAIYDLTDDVLRVCFSKGGKDRPENFNTEGNESVVYTFKRSESR
jgi:uncharacterized protein (TIGR03067 family)